MELWLGLSMVDATDLVAVALAAEEAGIGGVAMSDHLVFPGDLASAYPYSDDGTVVWEATTPWPDSWVAIGAMAAATTRLRLATGVFVAPLRHPVLLAKAVSTAAAIAGDRVVCGLGAGWMREEFEIVGETFADRCGRLDELIEVMRLLWSGEMVSHDGPHYRFGPVQMRPAPRAPVPIWTGGNTRPAKRRAAHQDGWICSFHDVDQAAADLSEVRRLRREALGDGEPFGAAVVGRIRDPDALGRLRDEGYDVVIVPLAALTRGRTASDWQRAVDAAASLAASLD